MLFIIIYCYFLQGRVGPLGPQGQQGPEGRPGQDVSIRNGYFCQSL